MSLIRPGCGIHVVSLVTPGGWSHPRGNLITVVTPSSGVTIHLVSLHPLRVVAFARKSGVGRRTGAAGGLGACCGAAAAGACGLRDDRCELPVMPLFLWDKSPLVQPGGGTLTRRVAFCCLEHAGQTSRSRTDLGPRAAR